MPDTAVVNAPEAQHVVVNQDQLEGVLEAIPVLYEETRKGWKTTEFWLTVASLVAVNASGVVMTLPDKYQAIASAIIGGLYVVSRGVAKKGVAAPVAAKPEA